MRSFGQHQLRWQRALRPSSLSTLRPQLRPCAFSTLQHLQRQAKNASTAQENPLKYLTAKWQPHWDSLAPQWHNLRPVDKGNAYVLPMFPYPSGILHLGHLRVYTISDVLARFKHMQGYHVLHPIGWDAFGLPAENAAIERGVHPEKWTLQNIDAMKDQMKIMGGRWDWDKEFRTCDPDFYKHNQRIFLMLHERGLAYRAESLVNYDPVDKTVLANEQVDANGCSWRSGAKVEKLMLRQWFLKIKEFQEPLLKDLDMLAKDGKWPEKVLAMQKNWLGRSEGTKLWFDIRSTNVESQFTPVDVFTTRADTLFGVQYIALSLNHPIVNELAKKDQSLQAFIHRAKELPPDSKEGYLLPNLLARNPVAAVAGETIGDDSIPVYVAPYVLDDYGSGAVMGVPGHDTRDHAFWRANAGDKPIRIVITSEPGQLTQPLVSGETNDKPFTEKGFVASNFADFSGLSSDEAVVAIVENLKSNGQPVEKIVNWRLRDWLISRQRYWGTPIPIIHCNSCGEVPVPEKDLPVELPNLPDSFFQGRTGNPLADDTEWKKTTCPKCGSAAERETDTMDTFMDSSWYFFRFLDPYNKNSPVDPKKADRGMPVDVYVGGVEHAILHLLYARFISKFLATTPYWPNGKSVKGEPFKKLLTQGMVHGKTFSDPETGRFLKPDEVDLSNPSAPVIKSTGVTPSVTYEKMSKSKYNGVDPGAMIARYGADATRAHMLFQAPVSDVVEWDETKISGVLRWLQRVIRLSEAFWFPRKELDNFRVPRDLDLELLDFLHQPNNSKQPRSASKQRQIPQYEQLSTLKPHDANLWFKTQQTIASVTQSYSKTYALNTVISDLMTLTNKIWDTPHASKYTPLIKWFSTVHLLRMLAPVAPGVAEEGWHLLHSTTGVKIKGDLKHPLCKNGAPSIFAWGFPRADTDILPYLNQETTCVFQVDGKKRFEAKIPKVPQDMSANDMYMFVLKAVIDTPEGKIWFDRGSGKIWKASVTQAEHSDFKGIPSDWKVIVAKGGAILNLIGPKKPKKKDDEMLNG